MAGLHYSLIRDRIVCGITKTNESDLREADLTQERAIDICRASEITTTQVKALMEEVEMNRIITVRPKDNRKLKPTEEGLNNMS